MQESTKDKEIIGKILSDWVAGKKEIDNANNSQEFTSVALSDFLFDDGSAKTVDMIKGRTTVLKGGAATWFCENVLWGGWGIVEKMPPSTYVASIKNESIKSFNDMFSTDVDK